MVKKVVIFCGLIVLFFSFRHNNTSEQEYTLEELRNLYSKGNVSNWPKPNLHESIDKRVFQDIGLLPEMPFPADNPYTKEKAELGKMLFFEPRISSSGQISCANCHNPELGWTDNLTRSFGHDRQTGKRNAMTILNVGYANTFFWDGRAASLEIQSVMPIQDQVEMKEHLRLAVKKVKKLKGYQEMFAKAFPDKQVSVENMQKAIATFERTITSGSTKFDRFISGKANEFTDDEVMGMHLYRTKAGCINCHNTPYFSDNQFHNDGQTLFGTKDEDFGVYKQTKNKADIGKFKTPTLREIARTGPWMHHGHFPSLLDVVEFYNLGNPSPVQKKYLGTKRDSLLPKTSPMLKKLDLSKTEVKQLVAFLNTLNSATVRMKAPELPKK
jgi:cytochrome c peroxidase